MVDTHNIILAHDSFTQDGGAERVVQAFHELYPEAPVYTLVQNHPTESKYSGWDIRTSPLQYVYKIFPHFQYLFFCIPIVLLFFKLRGSRILLSSSSAYLKGLRKPHGCVHIQYCHTPTRFLWTDQKYAEQEIHPILRPIAKLYFSWLRRWDFKKAQTVDYFIANSKEVQARIKRFYNRESVIIHPFISTSFWKKTRAQENYFLLAGRLQPYKNNEMVIRMFSRLGLPLHVVGTGRQEQYLRSIAGANIIFLGRVSDEKLRDEYSGAVGFIYPQHEDFGIMPLEAAACGTPTICLNSGGSLETVIPGVTGELFDGTETSLERVVTSWDGSRYKPEKLITHANTFSKEIFKQQFGEFMARIENGAGSSAV